MAKPGRKTQASAQQRALEAEIDAVLAARHDNPFAFLGMHAVSGGLAVRVVQPRAARVWLLEAGTDRAVAELPRVRPEGFFALTLEGAQPFAYRLRLEYGDGETAVIDDAYRFGPVLGELDLHLLGEGRHLHLYRRMGAHVVTHEGVAGVAFAVWAPNARRVALVADVNHWDGRVHPMRRRHGVGVW